MPLEQSFPTVRPVGSAGAGVSEATTTTSDIKKAAPVTTAMQLTTALMVMTILMLLASTIC